MAKLSHLSELGKLHLYDCEQLIDIPELPSSLKQLDASGCKSLKTMAKLSHLYELRELRLYDCE
ncbi:hypothetical protein AMTRI_Chr10g226950 [Amborella trichopoda]